MTRVWASSQLPTTYHIKSPLKTNLKKLHGNATVLIMDCPFLSAFVCTSTIAKRAQWVFFSYLASPYLEISWDQQWANSVLIEKTRGWSSMETLFHEFGPKIASRSYRWNWATGQLEITVNGGGIMHALHIAPFSRPKNNTHAVCSWITFEISPVNAR